MAQNLTILIHPRTKPPKSKTAPPDPFPQDIAAALTAYITALVHSRVPPSTPSSFSSSATINTNSNLIHLAPPARMLPSGCWCPDANTPSPHTWKTCPRFVPQPIVALPAHPTSCTHTSDTETAAHLFCFDPSKAAAEYMAWFTHIPGPPEPPLAEEHAAYLGDWLREHYAVSGRCDDDGELEFPRSEAEAQAHLALLCRVFVELRGLPPGSRRLGGWYDAERVHALLGWGEMGGGECMEVFLPWIRYAKLQRLRGLCL